VPRGGAARGGVTAAAGVEVLVWADRPLVEMHKTFRKAVTRAT